MRQGSPGCCRVPAGGGQCPAGWSRCRAPWPSDGEMAETCGCCWPAPCSCAHRGWQGPTCPWLPHPPRTLPAPWWPGPRVPPGPGWIHGDCSPGLPRATRSVFSCQCSLWRDGKYKFWLEIRIFDSQWPAGRYFVARGLWWPRREPVGSPEAVTSICFPTARAGPGDPGLWGKRNSQVRCT